MTRGIVNGRHCGDAFITGTGAAVHSQSKPGIFCHRSVKNMSAITPSEKITPVINIKCHSVVCTASVYVISLSLQWEGLVIKAGISSVLMKGLSAEAVMCDPHII